MKTPSLLKRFLALNPSSVIRIPARTVKSAMPPIRTGGSVMKDIDIQHTNGKILKVEWHHYRHGDDKPIMRVLILQRGEWVVIMDHDINEEV
jgi:hypothetical protein